MNFAFSMNHKFKIHFEISERKVLLRFCDVFFILGTLQLVGNLFQFDYFTITQANFYWTILLTLYILLFGTIFEIYNLQAASNSFLIIKNVILTSSATTLTYFLTPFFTPSLPNNRLQIIIFYTAILISLLLWRIVYANYFSSKRFFKNVIFIGQGNNFHSLVNSLISNDPNYKIVAYLNIEDSIVNENNFKQITQLSLQNLESFIKKNKIVEIVVGSTNNKVLPIEIYKKLIKLVENGVVVREYNQVYENMTQRISIQSMSNDFYKFLPFSRINSNKLYLFYVRFFEILTSLVGLFIGLLILPLILIGNVLGNKGSLFYTQERVGKNGIPFKIYKLRSMIKNAEKIGAVFATQNDSRITKFGKFLRKSRLDEVPQFINVLKGDMSIIGPRPERPYFVNQIVEKLPFYETRHVIKPGLTGWAQVNYSYGENIEDSLIKLQYDLYYIKNRSVFLDISIILKTISTVIFYKGQ